MRGDFGCYERDGSNIFFLNIIIDGDEGKEEDDEDEDVIQIQISLSCQRSRRTRFESTTEESVW